METKYRSQFLNSVEFSVFCVPFQVTCVCVYNIFEDWLIFFCDSGPILTCGWNAIWSTSSICSDQLQPPQESTSEFLEHKKDLEILHGLLKEIASQGLPGDKALVFEKTNNLSKKFKEMEDTIKEK